VRDALENITTRTATYTFNDLVPTADDFTLSANIGNTAKTWDWKLLSNAQEWLCWPWDISFDSIITQWTKWTCSVVWDIITYTPSPNKTWSDSCVVQIKDNENSTVNFTVTVDGIHTTAPVVWTAELYNWNYTWIYYKWIVSARASVVGSNISTCQYTIWWSWMAGTYSNWYCYANNISPNTDITLNFRATDTYGNVWTWTSNAYKYDATGPTFTFNNRSGRECSNWTLIMTNAVDTGVWLHTNSYSFNGSTWSTTTSIIINAQQPWTVTRTWYVRDALENITTRTATYTFNDLVPTADDFTLSANIGNTAKTWDWKLLSNAQEWLCWPWDISFDSIITQWTKWTCSVVWDIITYTPSPNKTWSDSCVVQIKDNENSTVNFTVTVDGIHTTAPVVWTAELYNWNYTWIYYKWIVSARASVVGSNISTCQYTIWWSWMAGTYSNWYCYANNISPNIDITLNFRATDTYGNVWTWTSNVYKYDATGPTFTFNNRSGRECSNWTLIMTNAVDTGVWLHTNSYSFNGSTWSTTTSIIINAQQPWTVTRTWYVRDALENITTRIATYTFNDSVPTANNFTGHANVWSGTRTVNWKLLSNATDGACW
jgi:hypothetical protein